MFQDELGLSVSAALPTARYVRCRLDYDPDTGAFTWRERPVHDRLDRAWNGRYSGKRAGSLKSHGYWRISIDDVPYYASRLAWVWMTGFWPKHEIDHRNLNPADDRWENLREATHGENSRNRAPTVRNTSGYAGVHWHAQARKWNARGPVNGRIKSLGLFSNLGEAVAARKAFEAQHFGRFAYRPKEGA